MSEFKLKDVKGGEGKEGGIWGFYLKFDPISLVKMRGVFIHFVNLNSTTITMICYSRILRQFTPSLRCCGFGYHK